MNVLLINTSSAKIEFAYNKNGNFSILKTLDDGKNADDLIFEMKSAFENSNEDFKKVEYIALSNGPGSYTGLRIGSAIAKGICFSLDAKLVELSSLDILANKFEGEAIDKIVTPLIYSNSKTGEFYSAGYIREGGKIKRVSEYGFLTVNELTGKDRIYVSDETIDNKEIFYTGNKCNMTSMYELFLENVNNVSDYKTSEPFYMKKFLGY